MKIISYIIGIIVTLAGIIGFFSESVLGILETNNIQNIVYIVLGLLLLMAIMKGKTMLTKIIGIIFAILGILGFVTSGDAVIGLVQNTSSGNWFHLIIGIIIMLTSFINKGGSSHDREYQTTEQSQQPEISQQQQHSTQM